MLFANFIKNAFNIKSMICNKTGQLLKYSTFESKLEINNQTINYIKTGTGKNPVLCMPGSLGTISNFKPQIENLDKNKFTIVAWDPPGYGSSRPPIKSFSPDFYNTDADFAKLLMEKLNFNEYSVLGWSDGGSTALILAAKYPNCVKKLVVWGTSTYILPEEMEYFEKMRDVSKWPEATKAPLVKMYTEEGLQEMQNNWCDAMRELFERKGDICGETLKKIKCPTFILHGDRDPVIAPEHPTHLSNHIKKARLHRFAEGKHNIHLRYPEEFNKLITEFLLE